MEISERGSDLKKKKDLCRYRTMVKLSEREQIVISLKSVLILLIQLPTGRQNIALLKEELINAEMKEFISNRMYILSSLIHKHMMV